MTFHSIAAPGVFRAMLQEAPCLAANQMHGKHEGLPGCPLARLSSKLSGNCTEDDVFGNASSQQLTDIAEWVSLAGGNSNAVFLVRPREGAKTPFSPMVYREYGSQTGTIVCRNTEVRMSVVLAQAGIAPRIHSVFPDGRLESFLEGAKTATSSDLTDFRRPELLQKVFEALVALHKVDWRVVTGDGEHLPHVTEPHIHRILGKLARRTEELLQFSTGGVGAAFVSEMLHEVSWISKLTAERCRGDCVTSHNDLNPGNVLYRRNGPDGAISDLYLIDFEYADFNLRCFDIGNVLCELDFDYSCGSAGFIQVLGERRQSLGLPGGSPILPALIRAAALGEAIADEHEAAVAKHIVCALRLYHNEMPDLGWDGFVSEVLVGMLCSHLMWGLWSILMALEHRTSSGALNIGSSGLHYDAYGQCRLHEYALLKGWLAGVDGV